MKGMRGAKTTQPRMKQYKGAEQVENIFPEAPVASGALESLTRLLVAVRDEARLTLPKSRRINLLHILI